LRVTEVLATYRDRTLEILADPKLGIPARCKFLPSIAEIIELASDIENPKPSFMLSREFVRREVDPESYRPKQIPVIFDRRGNRVRLSDAIDDEKWRAGMARAQRMTMFIHELGGGDSLRGWEIAMERGLSEPPEDWQPANRKD
jgi:hypothetical protein